MELRRKKEKTLFWLFLKQVIGLSLTIFLEVVVFWITFSVGINTGVILPASYAENAIQKNEALIAGSNTVNQELIPYTCHYGIYDESGNYKEGDLGKNDIKSAKQAINDPQRANGTYYVIPLQEGYCVIQYDVMPHFANPSLNQFIPHLELTTILLFILIFIGIVVRSSLSFCKQLKSKLSPLFTEIDQIKNKNLESDLKNSDIKEINDVLLALDDLKIALANSLKKEWETEQRRIDNVSALAHDIKTPLTVIKGNAELLREETEPEFIAEQLDVVDSNVDKIERYIELLIGETKKTTEEVLGEETISCDEIASAIETQSKELCTVKKLPIVVEKKIQSQVCHLDVQSLIRAIMNLVTNAAEHTTLETGIKIWISSTKNEFIVKVEDFGTGFSQAALQHAKEQFYTERIERSGNHYGLGMYFANQIAEKYNGTIEYTNKAENSGAIVTFQVQLN